MTKSIISNGFLNNSARLALDSKPYALRLLFIYIFLFFGLTLFAFSRLFRLFTFRRGRTTEIMPASLHTGYTELKSA